MVTPPRRRFSRARVLARVLAFAALFVAPSVAALGSPPPGEVEAADKLYAAAKAAMDRGDLEAACRGFAESQARDPAPGTLLNLGECEARTGKLASALAHFQSGRAALPAGDYRVAFADERIAQLTTRVPRLAIRLSGTVPPGSRVQRDGVDVPAASLGVPVPVDPGAHHVVATRDGVVVAQTDAVAHEGQVDIAELSPIEAAAPPASSPQRTAGFVLLGVGAATFGAGVVLGVVAKLTYDSASSSQNCPHGFASCDATGVSGGQTAHTQAAAATGTILAGAAVAAGGLTIVLLAPKGASVAVSPTVGASGYGLALGGRW